MPCCNCCASFPLCCKQQPQGLPCEDKTDDAIARSKAHIADLNCGGYVDLLLVHWPGPQDADMGSGGSKFADACSWDFYTRYETREA